MREGTLLFDHLPEGHVGFPVVDAKCMPLIQPGEVAVIDIAQRRLEAGALFLRRFISCTGEARMYIFEAIHWPGKKALPGGQHWMLIRHNRPRGGDDFRRWSAEFGPVPMADGPLLEECLEAQIIGRVVGIIANITARDAAPSEPDLCEAIAMQARQIMLEQINRQIDGKLNELLIGAVLQHFGLVRNRDWVRAELRTLASMSLIELANEQSVMLATITPQGRAWLNSETQALRACA